MDAELKIPIIAAFSGWRGIPWIVWASSNLAPSLVLERDGVAFKLLRTRRKPYSAISLVDYRSTWATKNVVLEFSDQISTFIGNTNSETVARIAIERLRDEGCPLSKRAKGLVAASDVSTAQS